MSKTSGRKLPIPNAKLRLANETGDFTPEEVRGLVCNPIYAGMGPYPRMLSDEEWVATAVQEALVDAMIQFSQALQPEINQLNL